MKIKILFIALLGLIASNTIFSQSVVVNKYQNVGTAADIFELLVIQDNANLQGLTVKSFSSNNANDNGGSITFTNNALWSSLRAGTLIVVRLTSTGAIDTTTSCTDFNLDIGGSNTTYFTVNSGTFDLASNDMCMIKSGTNTGTTNNIHTLRAGTAAAQWTGISGGTRLGTTTTVASNSFAIVNNASSVIGDYNLGTSGVTVGTGYTFGSGNNATNTTFINFLRGPISSAATNIDNVSFSANWGALTGAVSYVLDVATDSAFTSFVSGFNGLNVGNVTTYSVTGLSGGPFYYRVRAVNATPTTSGNSCTQTVSLAKVSQTNGDWNVGTTWIGGVAPSSTDNVIIRHIVFLPGTNSITTRNAGTTTTVDLGATLATADVGLANTNTYINSGTTNINGTFRVEGDSSASGNGFVYGAGATLNFNNNVATKSVPNTSAYWPASSGPTNVNVVGDISLGASMPRTVSGTFSTGTKATPGGAGITSVATSILTLNGTIRIDNGGQFADATSSPIYGPSSTLVYNTGVSTNRFNEWSFVGIGTIGSSQGYPNNVQLSTTSTNLTYNSNTAAKAMAGNLTIDNGCTFNMAAATTSDLTIAGTVTNNGTFTFSTAATTGGNVISSGTFTNAGTVNMASIVSTGGNLKLDSNFINSATAVAFNGGNRGIYFRKTGTQTIQNLSGTPLTFGAVLTTGTGTTVQLLNNLIIAAPANTFGAVAVNFGNAADVIDINGNTLTIGSSVANTISGSGAFKGSTTSNLTLLGTGSIGTLKFASNLNLGTFTMNRTAASTGCVMGSALTINTSLVLTNGLIDLGANTMTLASTCSNSFTASANSYVIADATISGGVLSKVVTATGTGYIFPVGLGGYSPATVNFTAGTFAAATLGMAVKNAIDPNWFFASTDYLNRYWSLTTSGITTPTYDFSATYPPADITGSISAFFKSNQWDGSISDWTNGGTVITSGTISKTGCTVNNTSPTANHISAAIRDQEIEVKSGVAGITILNGTILTSGNAAFGTKTVGSNTQNTFSIYNYGGVNLTIGAITISGGINPSDFVVTALPSSPVAGESSTTFKITFTPSSSGYRWATVSIPNNDSNENPYTFVVDGTGQCSVASTNTITPNSGPIGTEVTITAVTNNLYSATASLSGVSASISSYSPSMATATVIKAIIPAGAVSGQLTTTNNIGCQATNYFTVFDNAITSCEGTGTGRNKIFISEITDHGTGSHSFIELFNATGSSVNISGYTIKVYYNGGSSTSTITIPTTTNLANNTAYVIGFGGANAADVHGTYIANQTSAVSGINSNDNIRLYDATATQIDQWGSTSGAIFTITSKDYTYRRKNTGITAPSTTWNANDWISFSPVDYTDIGKYDYSVGTPPSITQNLTYTATCKATTLTVAAVEGYTGVGNINTTLTYQWFSIPNASNTWSSAIVNGGIYSGATTNSLYISDISTLTGYQFYCQIMDNPAACYTDSQAVKITSSTSTTWQAGNTWTNGVPTINTAVIMDNDYDTVNGFSPSFDACSLTINNGKTVTIRANTNATIQNDLTVTGSLNVESDGSLVMIDDNGVVTNTGTTQVKRTAAGIRGYDYVYWSSPVIGQSVGSIYSSPTPGYIYKWNPLANNINSPTSSGTWQATSGTMDPGTGYIVRGSSSYGMAASSIPAIFTGAVNSGIVPVTISRGSYTGANYAGANTVTVTKFDDNWNLLGNPYPSAIKALDFLTANANIQGFVYLWTHGAAPVSSTNSFYNSFLYNYVDTDYIVYNGLGTVTGPTGFNGYIAAGQGFFVLMNDGATGSATVNFKNSMRNKTYGNTQFYRTSSNGTNEKHRIWLDLVDSNNISARTLIGYVPEATLGLDRIYDAYKNTANNLSIYSVVEDQTLIIQGRPSPFDTNDQVPIGVRIMQDGVYKIAIGAVDGLFSDSSQNIYLEDKLLGIIYDLRQNPYSFNATAGIINDRFVLRYNGTALSNPNFESTESSVVLTSNHGQIIIKSFVEAIQDVTVFDILGRQLFEAKSIGNKDFVASNISMSQQALIVKIKLEDGKIVTRKIIL